MIGLVVASHGHLAQELLATAEQIVGPLNQTIACSVEPGASPEEIKAGLRESIERVDSGEGVLVFADLIGGTPCTTSLSFCKARALEVLTGVNLPMLLRAVSYRHEALDALVARAVSGGTQGVMQVAITAPQNQTTRLPQHDPDAHHHQQ